MTVLRPTQKAQPADSRVHNTSLVLRTLFHSGPQSRASLARFTGLTRVSISQLVADLLAKGILVDHGPDPTGTVGKPANTVSLVPSWADILTIDLSDDMVARGAICDLTGQVKLHREVAMAGATGQVALDLAIRLISALLQTEPTSVLGIGVATPGVVMEDGVIGVAPGRRWTGLPIGQRLVKEFNLPVFVGNDANLSALAEFTFGGAGSAGLMMLTVGRGLGAGVLLDGALLHGVGDAAGEIGHVTAVDKGERCACGRIGCLETVLNSTVLRQILQPEFKGSKSRQLDRIGRLTGQVLAPVVSAFNLNELVISRSDGPVPPRLLAAIEATIKRRVLPTITDNLIVRPTTMGQDVALLGGCALVLSEVLGIT